MKAYFDQEFRLVSLILCFVKEVSLFYLFELELFNSLMLKGIDEIICDQAISPAILDAPVINVTLEVKQHSH